MLVHLFAPCGILAAQSRMYLLANPFDWRVARIREESKADEATRRGVRWRPSTGWRWPIAGAEGAAGATEKNEHSVGYSRLPFRTIG
jgi:hypothetical protein